jgi:hypothetical protein
MQLGRIRLGQGDQWWPKEGRDAISSYDQLMMRVPLVNNEQARTDILAWIGRSDLPGSPAERHKVVSDALAAGVGPSDIIRQRVTQLEEAVASLEAKVDNAEEAYGTLPAAPAAGSTSEAGVRGLVISGSIALLGLVVAPLLLD